MRASFKSTARGLDPELCALVRDVLARAQPSENDRDDCWQTAYMTGLELKQTRARSDAPYSRELVIKKMNTEVIRLLQRQRRQLCNAELCSFV